MAEPGRNTRRQVDNRLADHSMDSRQVPPLETHSTHDPDQRELLRAIPSVDELLSRPVPCALQTRFGRSIVVDAAREVLKGVRDRIASGALSEFSLDQVEQQIAAAAE